MKNYKFNAMDIEAPVDLKEKAFDYTAAFLSKLKDIQSKVDGPVEIDSDDIYAAFLNGLLDRDV